MIKKMLDPIVAHKVLPYMPYLSFQLVMYL